ncbi:MAG TPA: ABC transporter permease [Methylomirabilota bacterium]|jgi:ABC-2 type transport system permease protein
MMLTAFLAMVRKDLTLFANDRRALVMAFAAPIAIASFFGSIFPGPTTSNEPARVAIHLVDEDGGAIAAAIVAGVKADRGFKVSVSAAEPARAAVRRGASAVAVIIPPGFGEGAGRALLAGRERPQLELLYDPSRAAELAMVRGILTEHVMRAVAREVFPGRPDFALPYHVRAEAMTARAGALYNGYAHSFAGMGVQFLFFAAIDLGLGVLLERQRGLWKRLRSAPVSRFLLLAGKAGSGTVISLATLLASFGFAMLVFGVRIHGSVIGFLAVALACALMASTFGLLIAALGNTPGTTRGLAILAVLLMVMLGGAWVPTFIFPAWLQQLTVVVPARWAVDGLDAMTWRGLGLSAALAPAGVLLAFAALFGALAVARFRWEES